MDYKLLSSLYYEDKVKYEKIYQNRINSESTYNLNFNINKFSAFVVLTPEILEIIQKILELNYELNNYVCQLPQLSIDLYSKKCLITEIKKTNDIENIYSTKKEIKRILNSPDGARKIDFTVLLKSTKK